MTISFNLAPVDVVNEALGQLGKDFITDLDDDTDPTAVKAKQYFGSLFRTMLRGHDWNFAHERVALAVSATAPVSGFTFAYPLPGDCFHVRRVNGTDHPNYQWKLEGRSIVTNLTPVVIEYTRWIDDPNLWDGEFHQAFVTRLATRYAPAFHVDTAKASDLYKLYQMEIADAKASDAQEGSQDQMTAPDYLDIRE
jgi:hypothetical protein